MSFNKINRRFNPRNKLSGKVVFVVGYDLDLLRPLALGLAEKGANIVLFSQKLPESLVQQWKSMINSLDQQILFLSSTEYKSGEFSFTRLFQTVRQHFGQIDVFIDLSTQREKDSYNLEKGLSTPLFGKWTFIKESLSELMRTSMFEEHSAKNQ